VIGLAATAALDRRPEVALRIAAPAEGFAEQEGIVNVQSNEMPGREFVDRARATLPADDADGAIELGRTLTLKEAPELAHWP
jgi:hypothetical protein